MRAPAAAPAADTDASSDDDRVTSTSKQRRAPRPLRSAPTTPKKPNNDNRLPAPNEHRSATSTPTDNNYPPKRQQVLQPTDHRPPDRRTGGQPPTRSTTTLNQEYRNKATAPDPSGKREEKRRRREKPATTWAHIAKALSSLITWVLIRIFDRREAPKMSRRVPEPQKETPGRKTEIQKKRPGREKAGEENRRSNQICKAEKSCPTTGGADRPRDSRDLRSQQRKENNQGKQHHRQPHNNDTEQQNRNSEQRRSRLDPDTREVAGMGSPPTFLKKTRVSPLLTKWVLISTVLMCVYTHPHLPPQMSTLVNYSQSYHLAVLTLNPLSSPPPNPTPPHTPVSILPITSASTLIRKQGRSPNGSTDPSTPPRKPPDPHTPPRRSPDPRTSQSPTQHTHKCTKVSKSDCTYQHQTIATRKHNYTTTLPIGLPPRADLRRPAPLRAAKNLHATSRTAPNQGKTESPTMTTQQAKSRKPPGPRTYHDSYPKAGLKQATSKDPHKRHTLNLQEPQIKPKPRSPHHLISERTAQTPTHFESTPKQRRSSTPKKHRTPLAAPNLAPVTTQKKHKALPIAQITAPANSHPDLATRHNPQLTNIGNSHKKRRSSIQKQHTSPLATQTPAPTSFHPKLASRPRGGNCVKI
jgi:hypothetical protein